MSLERKKNKNKKKKNRKKKGKKGQHFHCLPCQQN